MDVEGLAYGYYYWSEEAGGGCCMLDCGVVLAALRSWGYVEMQDETHLTEETFH